MVYITCRLKVGCLLAQAGEFHGSAIKDPASSQISPVNLHWFASFPWSPETAASALGFIFRHGNIIFFLCISRDDHFPRSVPEDLYPYFKPKPTAGEKSSTSNICWGQCFFNLGCTSESPRSYWKSHVHTLGLNPKSEFLGVGSRDHRFYKAFQVIPMWPQGGNHNSISLLLHPKGWGQGLSWTTHKPAMDEGGTPQGNWNSVRKGSTHAWWYTTKNRSQVTFLQTPFPHL